MFIIILNFKFCFQIPANGIISQLFRQALLKCFTKTLWELFPPPKKFRAKDYQQAQRAISIHHIFTNFCSHSISLRLWNILHSVKQ